MPVIHHDDHFDPPSLDHGARYHVDHLAEFVGPTFLDALDAGAIVDLDNRCADNDCAEQHVVVLAIADYDDLVRRATAHDRILHDVNGRVRRALVQHYAALVDNGYHGRWNPDGSVDWVPPAADPAGVESASDATAPRYRHWV